MTDNFFFFFWEDNLEGGESKKGLKKLKKVFKKNWKKNRKKVGKKLKKSWKELKKMGDNFFLFFLEKPTRKGGNQREVCPKDKFIAVSVFFFKFPLRSDHQSSGTTERDKT